MNYSKLFLVALCANLLSQGMTFTMNPNRPIAGYVNQYGQAVYVQAPLTWQDNLRDHLSTWGKFIPCWASPIVFGAPLYLAYREERTLQQKRINDEEARQRENLELRMFNDTDFVDALNIFIESAEREMSREYSFLLNCIEGMPLQLEEKKALQPLIEKACFSKECDEALFSGTLYCA